MLSSWKYIYIVTPQLRYPMNVFPIMTVTTDSLVAFFIAIPPYEYKHPSDTKYIIIQKRGIMS